MSNDLTPAGEGEEQMGTGGHLPLLQKAFASRRKGQGLVEFALVCIPMFVLLLGIMEISYAIFSYNSTQNAANDAVRRAMTLGRYQSCSTSGCTPQSGNQYTDTGNSAGTYTNPTCDGGRSTAGAVRCAERFMVFGDMTVVLCGPTQSASTTSGCGTPIVISSNCSDSDTSLTKCNTILPGTYVSVFVTYQYRPIIAWPVQGSIPMKAFAQGQVQ
jgi:Flp pilus assembly protein TadG